MACLTKPALAGLAASTTIKVAAVIERTLHTTPADATLSVAKS
jgi:hypothetical protein